MNQMFRFQDYPVIFLRPRITYPYAWVGHIPFAYLLVDLLRPRLLVELGTDSGNSYLAFCQAIESLGLQSVTSAVAVDSWEGDPHARFYGEDVYRMLSAYHDPRYGSFSRLHRAWFADALDSFENKSIDLLHIDGLHTYEAARNDFESWFPKLSDRAVVIFHDSMVRDHGFGVWKLIDELKLRYRCFEFRHSNGLAVVEVGHNTPAAFQDFFAQAIFEEQVTRSYFEAVAATIIDEKIDVPVLASAEPIGVECQIYHRRHNEAFSEAASMVRGWKGEGLAKFEFVLPGGSHLEAIRVDPANVPGVFSFTGINLVQGNSRISLAAPERIGQLNGRILPKTETSWLRFVALNADPYVELHLEGVDAYLETDQPMVLEVELEYETLLSDPRLLPLARASEEALAAGHDAMDGQWGYDAVQRQLARLSDMVASHSSGVCPDDGLAELEEHSRDTQQALGVIADQVSLLSDRALAADRRDAAAQADLEARISELLQSSHVSSEKIRSSVQASSEKLMSELSQQLIDSFAEQNASLQALLHQVLTANEGLSTAQSKLEAQISGLQKTSEESTALVCDKLHQLIDHSRKRWFGRWPRSSL